MLEWQVPAAPLQTFQPACAAAPSSSVASNAPSPAPFNDVPLNSRIMGSMLFKPEVFIVNDPAVVTVNGR